MLLGRYDAITITAAITGGDVLPSQSTAIPRGSEAIIAAAIDAAAAGAAVVHVHARDADGRPTADPELFRAIVAGVRAGSDAIVNVTTGGAPGMTAEERLAVLDVTRPELATFNLGTMNYVGYPDPGRWPKVEHDFEQEALDESDATTFVNTLRQMRTFAARFRELDVIPELEAYDLGHLQMARHLVDEGTLEAPLRLQLVLGVLGGAGHEIEDAVGLVGSARRILGDRLGSLAIALTGYPMQLRGVALAASLGAHCRVGLEDSLRMTRGRRAKDNAELVHAAARICEELGRPVATPSDVREALGLGASE